MSADDIETLNRRARNVLCLGIFGAIVMFLFICPITDSWRSELDVPMVRVSFDTFLTFKKVVLLFRNLSLVAIVIGGIALVVHKLLLRSE